MVQLPRILLVEDDSDTREVLAELLSDVFNVTTAPDGLTALTCAQEGAIDVIVTDESLPGLTGTELAKTLREQGSRIPILLVSGYRSGLDTSGISEILPKPIEVAALIDAVTRLLAGDSSEAHAPSV
jgi:CheY-like chemotaxis protein